jgi:Branched-chain amino acid transport protein (AzlD)
MMWAAVLLGSLGCYLIKLAGLSVPQRVLEDARVSKVTALLPVALLASLITIQTFTTGHRLQLDARAAGLASAAVAQLLRAPFLLVVAAAAATTALLRLVA